MTQPEEFVLFADADSQEVKGGFIYYLIVFLYSIEILIALLFYYLTFRSFGFGMAFIASSIPLLLIVIVQRLSPVVALILFLLKKREGWISVAFLNIITLLLNGIDLIQRLPFYQSNNKGTRIILISHAITFVLSVVITFLMILKPIANRFSIINRIKLQTIIAAVIFTFLLKYFIAGFIMNIARPH
jgi:hypothetical protein